MQKRCAHCGAILEWSHIAGAYVCPVGRTSFDPKCPPTTAADLAQQAAAEQAYTNYWRDDLARIQQSYTSLEG